MLIILLVLFAWAVSCLAFDISNTIRGLRAGVAVEGNSLVVAIAGNKPTLVQLTTIEGAVRLALLVAALFIPTPEGLPHIWQAVFSGAFFSYGLKNIQGGRQWRWLLANPGKSLPQQHTVWEKLTGFWG